METFTVAAHHQRHMGVAQLGHRLDQRIEHRLQVEGRAADDFEHVGGGGLLLEGFPQLVEQARVLDGDHGLAGKILHQRDLLVSKWLDLLAKNVDHADKLTIAEHRDAQVGTRACEFEDSNRSGSLV
jgi:hypothetical protein